MAAPNITLLGANYPAVSGVTLPKTGGGTATFPWVEGSQNITQNGTVDVTTLEEVVVNVAGGGGGDTYTRTVIVPQQTVSGQQPTLTHTGVLVAGEYYIATIDGTEYLCTAEPQWGGAALTIGDLAWYYGTPGEYDYPFAIGYEFSSGTMDCAISGSGSHTVKVEHLEFVDGPLNLIEKSITANGTYNAEDDDADGYSQVVVNVSSGGGKNVQAAHGTKRIASSAYTDVGYEITVAKTGTYNVYWAGWRSSTSGTNGAQLYVNGNESGNAVTTFDATWTNVQNGSRTSVSLTQGDKVTLRARSRGTSYYMYIFFLTIEEA